MRDCKRLYSTKLDQILNTKLENCKKISALKKEKYKNHISIAGNAGVFLIGVNFVPLSVFMGGAAMIWSFSHGAYLGVKYMQYNNEIEKLDLENCQLDNDLVRIKVNN